jgi:hypothetical protein
MDFSTFINLRDSAKVFLFEANVADEIEDAGWSQHGTYTNVWYTTYTAGFPNKVTEDDYVYEEEFSISDCNGNADSFYYDLKNQVLYLHTHNSDDPGSQTASVYDYKIVAFCWRHICNTQPEDQPNIFPRFQEMLVDGEIDIWTNSTTPTHWSIWTAGGTTSINRESSDLYSGGYCARIDVDSTPNTGTVYVDVKVQPSEKLNLSFWYKHSAGGGDISKWSVKDTGSNVYLQSDGTWQTGSINHTLSHTTDWTYFEIEFNAHDDYTDYRFEYIGDVASSSAYIDLASIMWQREDNYYRPYLQSPDLPSLDQSVSDYHRGSVEMNVGSIRFINDGWWYNQVQNYLWHNMDMRILYGAQGSTYDEFGLIYTGQTRNPRVGDSYASLQVVDNRILTYQEIPAEKYWTSNYPNLEDGATGVPIPLIYGTVTDIPPTCIDTTTYKYKVANHALEDITAVYKDGTALTITVDYTVDLANGEFTLTADPGDGFITCDVEGKKCDMEDGTFSENVADIAYDILVNYLGIDKTKIDHESFLDLKAGRTQKHMLYLDVGESAMNTLKILSASALFHLIPSPTGTLKAVRYQVGTDADTPRILDEEWVNFDLIYDSSSVYRKVRIRYNRKPASNRYAVEIEEDDNVKRKYDIDKTFTLTSSLRIQAEAENIATYYMDLMKDPLRKVTGNLPTKLFQMIPSEKMVLNKTRFDRDGNLMNILTEEAYRAMKLSKGFSDGRVRVEAVEDLQSAGETFCEVCYNCQTCYSSQQGITGSCSTCYTCEKCDSGQCDSCQTCYYCELCDTGECASCQNCNTCQNCDTGELTGCSQCDTCEKCNVGECESCQVCDTCQDCDTGECTVCESCDSCQVCNTCDLAQCSSCNTCELCNTCQNSQCTLCETCDTCETCNTCQSSQCSACEVCDTCERCNTGQCTACQVCDACEKCNTFEYDNCQNCVYCELCDTCQNSQCSGCESCNTCQNCDSCQHACFSCQKCDSGECTGCQVCNTCQSCNSCLGCFDCESCFVCEYCDQSCELFEH